MKHVFCSLLALSFLAQPALATSVTKLRKIQNQIQDQVAAEPGVVGIGIGICTRHTLPMAAGLFVPAIALMQEKGIAVYFDSEENMVAFAKKAVDEKLDLPEAVYCPSVIGDIVAQ